MLYPPFILLLTLVLIVCSLLAWRKRRVLNGIVQDGVGLLIAVFVVESLLGFFAKSVSVHEAHRLGAHAFVMLSLLVFSASLPAFVAESVTTRSLTGFRRVPSGIPSVAVALFLSFTGFLRPDGMDLQGALPDTEKTALLRFYVLHTCAVPLLQLVLLLRWYVVMRRTNREAARPHSEASR